MLRWYLNKCPIRAGKSRLFSRFEKQITRHGPVLCSYDGDLRIRADLRDWVQRQIFMYGTYRVEDKHRHFMLSHVRAGDTVLDIGAHIGYYTLLFAKRVAERGRVMAFEPTTRAHDQLVENVSLNDLANVTAVKIAASDRAGTLAIHLADGSDTGSSSLHFDYGDHDTEEVQTITVDDYLSRHGIHHVDLIKIDVEGHELHALRGMRRCLGASDGKAPKLFIEVSEATLASAGASMGEIFDELTTAGYKAYRIVANDRAKPEIRPFADSLVFFDKQ